jgi:hypothetical protein
MDRPHLTDCLATADCDYDPDSDPELPWFQLYFRNREHDRQEFDRMLHPPQEDGGRKGSRIAGEPDEVIVERAL